MTKTQSFISIYALVLSLGVSLVALHTLRTLALKKDITMALIFQKQSMLYAKSLKEMALLCLKKNALTSCRQDSLNFDSHFTGRYILSRIKDILLLDISISSRTLFSTHVLRHSARYIIKGYK